MSQPSRPTREESARAAWRRWASSAAAPELPAPVPAGFVDRVLAGLASRRAVQVAGERQRLVSAAAWLAMAASLVVCLWGWRDLAAAWSPAPVVLEPVVRVEPWP